MIRAQHEHRITGTHTPAGAGTASRPPAQRPQHCTHATVKAPDSSACAPLRPCLLTVISLPWKRGDHPVSEVGELSCPTGSAPGRWPHHTCVPVTPKHTLNLAEALTRHPQDSKYMCLVAFLTSPVKHRDTPGRDLEKGMQTCVIGIGLPSLVEIRISQSVSF